MKRIGLMLLMVALLLAAFPLYAAQPPDFDKQFLGDAEAYSFRYPADWEESEIGSLYIPIPSTGAPNNGIGIETEGLSLLFAYYPDQDKMTAAEFASQQAQEFADLGMITDPLSLLLNGKPLAQVDVLGDLFDFTYLAYEMKAGNFLLFTLTGTADQITHALPLAYEVLGTARLRDDISPVADLEMTLDTMETYSDARRDVAFDYPADWSVDDTADSYVLLTSPNGVSYGFSNYTYPSIPPEGMTVNDVTYVAEGVQSQVSTIEVSDVISFESAERVAARIDMVEPAAGQQMSSLAVEFDEDSIGKISVIGHPAIVGRMDAVTLALLASLRPAQ